MLSRRLLAGAVRIPKPLAPLRCTPPAVTFSSVRALRAEVESPDPEMVGRLGLVRV